MTNPKPELSVVQPTADDVLRDAIKSLQPKKRPQARSKSPKTVSRSKPSPAPKPPTRERTHYTVDTPDVSYAVGTTALGTTGAVFIAGSVGVLGGMTELEFWAWPIGAALSAAVMIPLTLRAVQEALRPTVTEIVTSEIDTEKVVVGPRGGLRRYRSDGTWRRVRK